MKHLLILEVLQKAASEFPTLAAHQRDLETSIQLLKKPTANHLRVTLKVMPKQASKCIEIFTIISAYRTI
jgi:hypothetical protein